MCVLVNKSNSNNVKSKTKIKRKGKIKNVPKDDDRREARHTRSKKWKKRMPVNWRQARSPSPPETTSGKATKQSMESPARLNAEITLLNLPAPTVPNDADPGGPAHWVQVTSIDRARYHGFSHPIISLRCPGEAAINTRRQATGGLPDHHTPFVPHILRYKP